MLPTKDGEVEMFFRNPAEIRGKLVNHPWPESKDGWRVVISKLDHNKPKAKSSAQRNALHVWCRELAGALNDAGLDQRAVLDAMKDGVDIPWTEVTVKENIWRQMQRAVIGLESTENISSIDPDKIYSILHRWLASKGFPCPPWPSRFND